MKTLTLPCPAKLNLFLHVTGRRADGYHTLQTVFQLLDIHDNIHLTPLEQPNINLVCNITTLQTPDNLVIRAARLLQAATQTNQGVHIMLDKHLPVGGGLGAGSSDAASTLIGLNHLWQTGLSQEALAKLALQLGADVPVFINGHTAWAEGVGEILTPVTLPNDFYVVLAPNCHVATARIFADKDLTRTTAPITMAAFLAGGGHNDCEPVARRLYPEVDQALSWLSQHAPNARMTGTGACVFTSLPSLDQAQALHQQVPKNLRAFIAQGVNQSALHDYFAP